MKHCNGYMAEETRRPTYDNIDVLMFVHMQSASGDLAAHVALLSVSLRKGCRFSFDPKRMFSHQLLRIDTVTAVHNDVSCFHRRLIWLINLRCSQFWLSVRVHVLRKLRIVVIQTALTNEVFVSIEKASHNLRASKWILAVKNDAESIMCFQ